MSTEGLGVVSVPDRVGDGGAICSADGEGLPAVETPAEAGAEGWAS
jgi:hypothetical protein